MKYTESDLTELLADDTRPVWCAVEDGQFLGYCFCQWEEFRGSTVMMDRRELYIDDLCVDESCRGRGVATALYRHVTAAAKAAGAAFITLNVWTGNLSAMRFYEKMGMKPRKITMDMALEDTLC